MNGGNSSLHLGIFYLKRPTLPSSGAWLKLCQFRLPAPDAAESQTQLTPIIMVGPLLPDALRGLPHSLLGTFRIGGRSNMWQEILETEAWHTAPRGSALGKKNPGESAWPEKE